jgi:Family of unknown function (DUF5338)
MSDTSKTNSLETTLMERAKQSNNLSYVEFLANLELIKSYLAKGFTAKTIWEALVDEKLITVHYVTFSRYLRKENLTRLKVKPNSGDKNITNNVIDTKTVRLSSNPKNAGATNQTETIHLKLPDRMSHTPMINPKDLI